MRPDSGYGRRGDDFKGRVEENLAGPGDWFYIEGEGESSLGIQVRYRTKEKQGFGGGRGWFRFSHEEMTGPCRGCPRGSVWDWLGVKQTDGPQQCMQLRPWADPLTQEGAGEGPIMRTEYKGEWWVKGTRKVQKDKGWTCLLGLVTNGSQMMLPTAVPEGWLE